MRPIDQCRLYGILDLGYVTRMGAIAAVEQMIDGGIDVIQLRAKSLPPEEIEALARSIHPLTRAARWNEANQLARGCLALAGFAVNRRTAPPSGGKKRWRNWRRNPTRTTR